MIKIFLLMVLGISSVSASSELAEKVYSQFSRLSSPGKSSSDFEKWTYTTAAMTAMYCWHSFNKKAPLPQKLKDFKVSQAGTFTLPKDGEAKKLCQSLATTGINSVCTHSTVWIKSVKRRSDLPIQYVQVHKNKPLEVEGSLECYLNSDQINKQTFHGTLKADWSEAPTFKAVNFSGEEQKLEIGTILITAPQVKGLGSEYREPKTAVVIAE